MKLTFFGAAEEVGRSCILVENKRILSGVEVSHAQLDHCGYLPHMFSFGFSGDIFATKPTLELTNVIVADYIKLSKPSDVTKDGIAKMVKHYRNIDYFKPFKIGTFEIKLYPAGHILGSSMVEVTDTETGKRLLYTGDINTRATRLLPPAYSEHLRADILLTESTYGGKEDIFPSERSVLSSFIQSVKESVNAGSKVIIPSFAVGRAQEVLFILNDFMRSGILPKAPIYIDGMINKAMRIYRHNVIFCREEIQKQILMSDEDPFKSAFFHEVKGRHERNEIAESKDAGIIVTTSGMLKGGPVVKYLEKMASDQNSKLIFVGYQAIGTPGRRLIEGEKSITLDNKSIQVNLKIEQYKLSAHADRPSLMKFMSRIYGLSDVVIIHGEYQKMHDFAQAVKENYNVHVPSLGSSVSFD